MPVRESAQELLLSDTTVSELLAAALRDRGPAAYLEFDGRPVTYDDLGTEVRRAVAYLREQGVRPGTRVAVMLANHPGHVALVLALVTMGAVWVPVNPKQRGEPLRHMLAVAGPELIVVEASLAAHVHGTRTVIWADHEPWRGNGPAHHLPDEGGPDDVVALMFTSGTTGPAKAVQVTDRMLRASALGAVLTAGVGDDDVLMLWEPLCHIGGAQVLLVPLVSTARIALLEHFSASRFWRQAIACGATHVHHLGGIVAMLLAQPESDAEREHHVRVSWGGGMSAELWHTAQKRFGVEVRECYGMTEASSIATMNDTGPDAGVGWPLPYFHVEIRDQEDRQVPDGATGEIVIRPRTPGLVTPGYLGNPEATAAAWRDGAWHTGDLGFVRDEAVHFAGRLSDSVRHRGENVSAWEVESVANDHPDVEESALIGVPEAAAEQELALFVTAREGVDVDSGDLLAWCRTRLASFQVPQYLVVIDAFEKTPSERIVKRALYERWDTAS